jgi:hypothetical protein
MIARICLTSLHLSGFFIIDYFPLPLDDKMHLFIRGGAFQRRWLYLLQFIFNYPIT